ncbi:MAG: hypothetical protein D8M59_12970 [Planctomycetes bacterium]|nr:hypothetical protein [Planctomycetota bacterium]
MAGLASTVGNRAAKSVLPDPEQGEALSWPAVRVADGLGRREQGAMLNRPGMVGAEVSCTWQECE